MPVRYGLHAVLVIGVLCGGAAASTEDDPAQPSAEARVAKILHEWELRSSARTSLDVRYTGVRNDRVWGDKEPFSGRVILIRNGRTLVEHTRGDTTAKKNLDPERLIWTDDAMHAFQPSSKTHNVRPIQAKDRGRLPAVLALPFFWNLSTEGLKSRYIFELVKEEPETHVLRIRPLSRASRDNFAVMFVVLDRPRISLGGMSYLTRIVRHRANTAWWKPDATT